jgi:hypothetical protein
MELKESLSPVTNISGTCLFTELIQSDGGWQDGWCGVNVSVENGFWEVSCERYLWKEETMGWKDASGGFICRVDAAWYIA